MVNTDILDLTDSRKQGPELHAEIIEAVKRTQRGFLRPLPNRLILNDKQFKSLLTDMQQLYQSKDYLFSTPLNVMEVEVAK